MIFLLRYPVARLCSVYARLWTCRDCPCRQACRLCLAWIYACVRGGRHCNRHALSGIYPTIRIIETRERAVAVVPIGESSDACANGDGASEWDRAAGHFHSLLVAARDWLSLF